MTPEKWEEVAAWYEVASGVDAEGREQYLKAQGVAEDVRVEVLALLAHEERAGRFLEAPVWGEGLERGQRVGHFVIEEKLGEGGMGVVYRAYDERLERRVALKVLPPEMAGQAARRGELMQEARAASGLIHANIVSVFEVGADAGVDYIAMELVEGVTLREKMAGQALPVEQALAYGLQMAAGLRKAHEAGVVHRDLKPANVMVTREGQVKLLDFGLAQRSGSPGHGAGGTPVYMSPEQKAGLAVDARTDIYSFGLMWSEMVGGRENAPGAWRGVLRRCLDEDRERRFADGGELHGALRELERAVQGRWRKWAAAAALVVLCAAGWGAWQLRKQRYVQRQAIPAILKLADEERGVAAYRAGMEIDALRPGDEDLRRLRQDLWINYSIQSEPAGAEVQIRDYGRTGDEWWKLGVTPLRDVRMPGGNFHLRLRKEGYAEVEGTMDSIAKAMTFRLQRAEQAPAGMVYVPVARVALFGSEKGMGGPFWMDKFEVTNRQYQEFADQGGYEKREYWRERFVESGRELRWEQAVARFRDRTGKAGPAGWSGGKYPEGRGEEPVGGVSWYEAAAYAAWAGKALPTVHHWGAAAAFGHFGNVLYASNFKSAGPAKVGAFAGVGRFGTYDLAGNVSEWCWNAVDERRWVRGGGWEDMQYMYSGAEAAPPMMRTASRGFRCVRYVAAVPEEMLQPVNPHVGKYKEDTTPVGDDVFAVYRTMYDYDRLPLEARVEGVDDSGKWWRRERISFAAGYPQDRVILLLFLPRNAVPPYQTILFFPGGAAQREKTTEILELRRLDFLLKAGYAVAYPVYQGMYERSRKFAGRGPIENRDMRIQWGKDVRRTIDYLETRADIDRERIAFYGVSVGGGYGAIAGAVEPRLRTLILQGGGLEFGPLVRQRPGEVRAVNFLPRVRMPVLMMNGVNDFLAPLAESQRPMFELLGTAAKDKRHAVLDTGHSLAREGIAREMLPWLEKYLGPVRRKP